MKVEYSREDWQREYEAAPKRDDGLETSTISGMEVPPLHTSEDVRGSREELPGQYPYTRGIHPTGYRGRLWTMRQFSGFATAEQTNRRYKYLLANGQNGLSVAFDMPTLMGQDSDAPTSRGEIGHCGVAIDSLADMETLFDGIPLGKVSTSMTINSPAAVTRGVDPPRVWELTRILLRALGQVAGGVERLERDPGDRRRLEAVVAGGRGLVILLPRLLRVARAHLH